MSKLELRDLPCRLEANELAQRAQQLADELQAHADAEAAFSAAGAKHRARKKERLLAIDRLGCALREGTELRPVYCAVQIVDGRCVVRRDDTGEVIENRAISDDEMAESQMELVS